MKILKTSDELITHIDVYKRQVREISAHYSVETACVSDISVRIAC